MTNNLASITYGNGEVLAGDIIPDRLSLEVEELSLDNPLSHILTSSQLNSSNRSREFISNFLLEKQDLVIPLKKIENSEITQESSAESKPIDLMAKTLQSRSFSTEDLISLATSKNPTVGEDIDKTKASISHLSYGCGCPCCGGSVNNRTPGAFLGMNNISTSLALSCHTIIIQVSGLIDTHTRQCCMMLQQFNIFMDLTITIVLAMMFILGLNTTTSTALLKQFGMQVG